MLQPQTPQLLLFTGMAFMALSIVFAVYKRYSLAMLFLLAGGLIARMGMAQLDPFLNLWDERYHALVAKNMMHHFLIPTLYERDLMPYDFREWTGNHIWLHKQPLALWQITLSYIIFGVNPFTTRIPTVILSSALIPVIYRMGVLTTDKKLGYIAALLFASSYYALNFCTGALAVDHVDMAFVAYVTLSFWAWMEYEASAKRNWVVFIGVFSGLALLTKWFTGLIVYAGWLMVIFLSPVKRVQWKSFIDPAISFCISLAIFIPWQLFIFSAYPDEARYEYKFNREHLFRAIEGHSGNSWFYFSHFADNYGTAAPFLFPAGLLLLIFTTRNKSIRNFLIANLVICYLFFSFVALTKMLSYCYIVLSVVFLSMASVIKRIIPDTNNTEGPLQKAFGVVVLLLSVWFSFNTGRIKQEHSMLNPAYAENMRYLAYCRQLDRMIPGNYLVFGAPAGREIETMYFTGNPCYAGYPDERRFGILKHKKYLLAAIQSKLIPSYMLKDSTVIKLPGMK